MLFSVQKLYTFKYGTFRLIVVWLFFLVCVLYVDPVCEFLSLEDAVAVVKDEDVGEPWLTVDHSCLQLYMTLHLSQ